MTIQQPLVNLPLSPPVPQDLYFSEWEKAWILSRHRDVLAALRSPDLSQVRPSTTTSDAGVKPEPGKACAQANASRHSEMSTAILSSQTSELQTEIYESASSSLRFLVRDRPVDLVSEFIRPWCLASAVAQTGVDPTGVQRLAQLLNHLSESDASPNDVHLNFRANEANRELDSFFGPPSGSYRKSIFLGTAQTVPYFVASAWAALLQYPAVWNVLRAHPDCTPRAIEELLRYAGPVHSVFRQAHRETVISGTSIAIGDRLILRLESANRDPEQFAEPSVLDIKRGAAGHVALSSGSHYCVGASLVRMMTAIATEAMLARYPEPQLSNPVEWSHGTMLIWPSSLPVLLGSAA